MSDLYLSLSDKSIWTAILILLLFLVIEIGCIRRFLKPAIVNPLDPLNIVLFTSFGPALAGFFLTAILTNSFSESFFVIFLFVVCWLTIIRTAGKPRKSTFPDHMETTFSIVVLSLVMLFAVLNLVVNMIIPGNIPLFAGGAGGRFGATENSRLLTWLSFGTAQVAPAMYALTESVRVRRYAMYAIGLQVITGLLFASKGGIFIIVLVLLNSLFVAREREDKARYKKIRRLLLRSSVVVALLIPSYLVLIGVGFDSGAVAGLGMRFLQGFDQLILSSQLDLLHGKYFGSSISSNIFEYQMMPFFKAFSSKSFEYSNVGQYVIEAFTGVRIEGPYTFPNSNLILETVFSSGQYLGFAVFIVEMCAFYWARRIALESPLKPWSFIIFSITVFNPTGLFQDGQGFVVDAILVALLVAAAVVISRAWIWLRDLSNMSPVSA